MTTVYFCFLLNRQEQERKRLMEFERQMEKQRQIEREKEQQRQKMMEQKEVCLEELSSPETQK